MLLYCSGVLANTSALSIPSVRSLNCPSWAKTSLKILNWYLPVTRRLPILFVVVLIVTPSFSGSIKHNLWGMCVCVID